MGGDRNVTAGGSRGRETLGLTAEKGCPSGVEGKLSEQRKPKICAARRPGEEGH